MDIRKEKIKLIVKIIIVILIAIYVFYVNNKKENIEIQNKINSLGKVENTEKVDISEKVTIYVTGEVNKKGVYELDCNSRIRDAIEIAGGLTAEASIEDINLADLLEDGMKIDIPNKSEAEKSNNIIEESKKENTQKDTKESENIKNDKVNINTANETELKTLPGIGQSTAKKIIDYRKENGKFSSKEEIKNVSGIGENKYNKIKDLIKI